MYAISYMLRRPESFPSINSQKLWVRQQKLLYSFYRKKKKKQANKQLRPRKTKLPANVHRNHSFAYLTNSRPCTMLGMEEKQIS